MWYDSASTIRKFGAILVAAGFIEDVNDFTSFLESPEQYDDVYDTWKEMGRPSEAEDSWDEFVEAVSSEEEST